MKQKSPPTAHFGQWFVKYKQVPYDNRYFFVSLDGVEVMKVPWSLYTKHGRTVFPFVQGWLYHHFIRFLDRVEAHNEYLDRSDR